jgi:hypothetical protein
LASFCTSNSSPSASTPSPDLIAENHERAVGIHTALTHRGRGVWRRQDVEALDTTCSGAERWIPSDAEVGYLGRRLHHNDLRGTGGSKEAGTYLS